MQPLLGNGKVSYFSYDYWYHFSDGGPDLSIKVFNNVIYNPKII